jgi:replicative DNA helicase
MTDENLKTDDPRSIRNHAEKSIEELIAVSRKENGISGVPSGFTALDRITNGWQNSDFIIIGGRPSMGKTAFILSMIRNISVDQNLPIALFSLENSENQITKRLIASETELGSEKLRSGQLADHEWEQLHTKIKKLVDAPTFIESDPSLNTTTLRKKCIDLKEKYGIKCFFIDYVQLMKADPSMHGNWEQDINFISRDLKRLALELNTPFIVTSQLNRKIEGRTGDAKKPMLSDLRDSGALEEDADVVLLLHRPERYGITEDTEGNSLIGIADIIIAKHRDGAVGEIQLRFRNSLAKYMDLENEEPSEFGTGYHTNNFTARMNEEPSDFDDAPPF